MVLVHTVKVARHGLRGALFVVQAELRGVLGKEEVEALERRLQNVTANRTTGARRRACTGRVQPAAMNLVLEDTIYALDEAVQR